MSDAGNTPGGAADLHINALWKRVDAVAAAGGGERAAVESAVWDEFGVEAAVFVLDMAGFSLLTQRHGLLHYLAMVRQMQRTIAPMIAGRGGRLVKFEADNCYATFDDVATAIDTGISVNRWFQAMNRVTADDRDIHLSIGIDRGRILLTDVDLYGNAVNLASKLGEDLAGRGEILVTSGAWEALPTDSPLRGEEVRFTVSGVELEVRRVVY